LVIESRENVLVERCRNGDRQALAELLGIYQRPIYNAAYRIVGNPDDAADVTQVVFLKTFENLDKYNPEYRFFSWIYRIAINESINHNKRSRNEKPLHGDEASHGDSPDRSVEARDLSRELQEGLMGLNKSYRAVVVLRHFSEFSYREIGEILDIPEKTVKSRLYSARQMLKKALEDRGVL
jgi:RNA polymerase sigma-70 factor (ECF subfamily)